MKKYILHIGPVVSQNDGQIHWLTARQLAFLYSVDPRECIIVNDSEPSTWLGIDFAQHINLYPKPDGDYSL